MSIVANLQVLVGADISTFTKNMDTVQNRVSSFGQSLGSGLMGVGGAITNVGNKMGAIGGQISTAIAPLNDLALSGLDAAAGFQDIMVQLETFGGLAGSELEAVKQTALDMGAATKFSASDAAGAMLELVKAGYSVDDSMVAANSSLTLAAIGNMNLESAAGIVSSTLSQFKLDVTDAGDVVDILAQAANASRSDVKGLGDSLQNVGVVASTMGFTMRETTAALAVMSNAGIEGAEAGTQLKSALLSLTTGEAAAGALKDLGVTLYDTSGNMKTLDQITDELSLSMANLTPEQKTQALKDLGGSYGITALSALMAAGGTDKMIESMIAAPGAVDLAGKAMGTFNGTVESLKGSVETLMIESLTPLMEKTLTPLVATVTEVVNSITDWVGKNPELASTIGGIVLGIGALGTVLAIAAPIISGIGLAISGLGAVIAFATGPLGLLLIAGAGLVALLNNPDIQNGLKAWEGVFNNLKIILGAIVEDVQMRLDDVAVGFRGFVRDITQIVDDLQAKAAAAQVTLGINVDANAAIVSEKGNASNAALFTKQLEADLNASIAAGGGLKIDVGTLQFAAEANGGAGLTDIAKQIVDPTLIQQAIDQAITSGDSEGLKALLPLSLELTEDPALQMQTLLTTALAAGGENSPVFDVLTAMATELQIDTNDIVSQYDQRLKEAAAAQTYSVTVDVKVKVNPLLDTSGIGAVVTSGAAGAAAGVTGGAETKPIKPLATGGYITSDGYAFVHAGEAVLNPQQQAAWNGGGRGGGGGNTYNFSMIGQNPYDALKLMEKAARDKDR